MFLSGEFLLFLFCSVRCELAHVTHGLGRRGDSRFETRTEGSTKMETSQVLFDGVTRIYELKKAFHSTNPKWSFS